MFDWLLDLVTQRRGRSSLAEPERYVSTREMGKLDLVEPKKPLPEGEKTPEERMEEQRKAAIAYLGSNYVMHPDYKCKAETYDQFMRQPPTVLNQWRQRSPDPNNRAPKPQAPIKIIRKS